MIQSNNINVRNLTSKKEAFNGVVNVTKNLPINAKGYTLVEIFLNVKVANPLQYLAVRKTGSVTTTLFGTTMYDENMNRISNRQFFFKTTGVHKIYVDTNSFDSLEMLLVAQGATAPFADVEVTYTLHVDKFSVFESLDYKYVNRTLKNTASILFKDGDASFGINNLPTNGKRYAIIASNVYENNSNSSHYFVSVRDADGNTSYVQSINIENGENVSYGNGQVGLNILGYRKTYVDLLKFNAVSLSIGRSVYDNVFANVSVIGFTDEKPEIVKPINSVLFEDDKFRFVKKTEAFDAWNGLIVNFDNHNIYLSDDLDKPFKYKYDLSSITSAESAVILEAYLIPYNDAQTNTTQQTRIVFSLNNRKVFHNYYNGGGATSWGESKFWEQRNTVRKIPTKNIAEVDALHRYDVTLPNDRYNRNATLYTNGATFIEFQELARLRWLGALCRTKKMVAFGTYLTTGDRICVWATTDGGANWVLQYDFINRYIGMSSDINTSTLANYTGGLQLKKINPIYPSDANKEPLNKFSYSDVAFSTITKGTSTIVNANAHGLVTGDMVLFTGTAQDNDWGSLVCEEFTSTGFKQIIYSVERIDNNSFKIKEYLGSYDRPLRCRHVHSVNESVGGLIVGTGEEYPDSWFLYLQQKYKDASSVVNAFNFSKSSVYRLNSSENGLQRPCGVIMDNATDPNILFNCDTSSGNLGNFKIDGRTDLPSVPSNGLWKGKLSDIDDWTKWECIMDIPEPGIWLYQVGSVIVGYYQLGGNIISIDGGKTFKYFAKGNSTFSGVWDNRIVLANGYIFEWK